MGWDTGSFIGGIIIGGIAGAIFVGWNALKIGVGLADAGVKEGWINQGELERDLKRYRTARARAYRTSSRAYPARAIYGHGTGTEGDLNRIPVYLG